MNRGLIGSLSVALLVAVGLIALSFYRDETTPKAGVDVVDKEVAAVIEAPDTSKAPDKPLTPMQQLAVRKLGIENEDAYEEVLGIRVRKDRNCTVRAIPIHDEVTGETSYAYECIPNNAPPPPHPYLAEDNDTLREWAYNDSVASEILGSKLLAEGSKEEGLEYIYRAVALEGAQNFNAFARAHIAFFSGIDYAEPPDYELKPRMDEMSQVYIFGRVRALLSDRDTTLAVRRDMEHYAFEDFASLDAEAARVVAEMARIEREVVGSNSIGERVDF